MSYALAYGDGGMDMDIDIKCLSNNECSVMECVTPWLTRMVTYLRNEFNFWNVHGIMNTSGLVQSK